MGLVDYSESEDEEEAPSVPPPPAKKRKIDSDAPRAGQLPPLPNAFHDVYSSSVRTSNQDDPSLHGGRKRVTPHVEGHWPTHVYLEWHPQPHEAETLSSSISNQEKTSNRQTDNATTKTDVHSLLHNDLGVSSPLHISLSRPLVLKTEQRNAFLRRLRQAIAASGVRQFAVRPADVVWHPNEVRSRWFQVMSLQKPPKDELRRLLTACNGVAHAFKQPLLYDDSKKSADSKDAAEAKDQFHISIAWALDPPDDAAAARANLPKTDLKEVFESQLPETSQLDGMEIHFTEVKVRIGQEVTALPLVPGRTNTPLFT